MMKTVLLAAASLATMSAPAFAGMGVPVPEIDAVSGGAALAIVGAAIALLRERSRR